MLLRLYLEIRDIWRPGAGLAGMRDSMAQIRDIPGNLGRVATLFSGRAAFKAVSYQAICVTYVFCIFVHLL